MGQLTFARVAAVLTLALLALPAARLPFVEQGAYEKSFALRENRPPARLDLVAPTPAGLRRNLLEFESWFTDRFGYRLELIGLQSRLYLRAGRSPREDLVVLGRDGWLFLGNGHNRVLDKAMGRLLFTDEQLEAYAGELEAKHRALAALGVRFMVVIAPNKHTIYPEQLPAWARNRAGTTPATQLAARMRGGEVVLADLVGTLRDAKARTAAPLYFKTDSHWNALGAYHAYRGIMQLVREHYPEARLLDEPPFREKPAEKGDLARMLAIPPAGDVVLSPLFGAGYRPLARGGNCGEPRTAPRPREESAQVAAGAQGGAEGGGAPAKPGGGQRYLALSPNECRAGQVAVVTGSGVARAPRLLLLGDSFANALSPYLNQSFGTVLYTYFQNAKTAGQLKRIVERHRPDLVVLQMVEREITPGERKPLRRLRRGSARSLPAAAR